MSSEVLIQCGVCKSNLSVDSQAVSTHVSCPHCHQRVLVPLPEIKFSCEICQTPYECLQALGGEIFDCVVCNDEFIVPTVGQELPLRNGRVTTTGARNILRFKGPDPHQTAAASAGPMPGATCQPPRRPSRIVFPSVSAFSILKYGAGIVLLILMINLVPSFLSTSPPSPPLSPSSPSAPSDPSAPSSPSAPSPPLSPPVVPTNTVDLTPWDGAADALKALQAKSRLKTKRLGKEAPAVAPPPSETTRRLTCENCKGTGRCAKCRGAGSISTPCTACNAKGTEFSKDNVRAECLLAIARCLELIAKQKQDRVPPAGGGQSDLAVRFHAACADTHVRD